MQDINEVIETHELKYDFYTLNDSGNCIIRKMCCIVSDLKRNVSYSAWHEKC